MRTETKGAGVARAAIALALASLVSGCILAATYAVAEPRIEKNREEAKEEAMRRLFPSALEFRPEDAAGCYAARSAGGIDGYILPAEGRGYGGTIRMTAAVDPTGKLLGFEILSHNETPGLGDRATERSFRDLFTGRRHGEFAVTKTGESGKIDALSGATITSKAVASALDEALGSFVAHIGGIR